MNDTIAAVLEKIMQHRAVNGAVLGLLAVLLALIVGVFDAFTALELKSYDLRFAWRGAQEVDEDNIVIVGIDDQSFEDLRTKWPFPRSYFARAIDNLAAAGARLIILDIEFFEPDNLHPEHDAQLAAAARRAGNVLLAADLSEYKRQAGARYLEPIELLRQSGNSWALINVPEDLDGFNRRYFLFRRYQEQMYVPFAIAVYRLMHDQAGLRATNGTVRLGSLKIPNLYNTFLVNFRGPAGTFPTHSFSSILDDQYFDLGMADDNIFDRHREWGTFADKIVFIGATSEVLQDVKLTPFFGYAGTRSKMPGVELHANALSTLLRGDFLTLAGFPLQLLVMLLLAAAVVVVAGNARPAIGSLLVLAVTVAYLILAYLLFAHAQLWLELVRPSLAIFFAYVGAVAQQVIVERREKGRVRRVFQQYVSKNIVDNMLASGTVPQFGGERRELTVLFSDIRSFTTFCENREPESVVYTLNEYLTAMVDIILRHNGTLDKFVGDEIMALFGAPFQYPDHPLKACETACEMLSRLRHLQKRWAAGRGDFFQIGIGINTGKMIVGNLGSQQLFDYTVIGDEVNVAARLEGANKEYGTSVIISEATFRQVQQQAVARELDVVRVKGKRQPVRIFELLSMSSLPPIEQELRLGAFQQGLALYRERQWYDAVREFRRIIRYFPSDGPTCLYIKRCLDFIESPPPVDWDGVYEFTSK